MIIEKSFPRYSQLDAMDCGATCLRMVAKWHGRTYSNRFLRERNFITHSGVSMLGISDAAESIGFRTMGVKIPLEKLLEAPLPCILHWNQNHFVILYKIKRGKFHIADPADSKYILKTGEFLKCWASSVQNGEKVGTALLLEPTPDFYKIG